MSASAGVLAMRAVAEQKAYPDAPMRTLLLDGAGPRMRWQENAQSFAKRHHVRIWEQPDHWRSRKVWAAAATHDVALSFSFRYGLHHEIHNNVDLERDTVVNDLRLTGCVDGVSYLQRPGRCASTKAMTARNCGPMEQSRRLS